MIRIRLVLLTLAISACTVEQGTPSDLSLDTRFIGQRGASCAKASECAKGLTCVNYRCVDPILQAEARCASDEACLQSGKCGFANGKCVPLSEQHCSGSRDCQSLGACGLVGTRCRPIAVAHCTDSTGCAKEHRCSLRGESCVWRPKKDEFRPVKMADGSVLHVKKTEVTQGEFESISGFNPSFNREGGKNRPVEKVTLAAAQEFANTLSMKAGLLPCYTSTVRNFRRCSGFRLMTEREWRWIAFDAPAPSPNTIPWTKENSDFESKAVCSSGIQRFGLCDVLGNVWEWTHRGGSVEPGVVRDEQKALVCGGSFAFASRWIRPPSHWAEDPKTGSMTVGFRVVTETKMD